MLFILYIGLSAAMLFPDATAGADSYHQGTGKADYLPASKTLGDNSADEDKVSGRETGFPSHVTTEDYQHDKTS